LFHRSREQEIIQRERTRAEDLGANPDFIENIFRAVFGESHRIQSEILLTASHREPKTIAIIGGAGAMGGFFQSFFESCGYSVLIADQETPLTPARAAALADVVIVSVPIEATAEVIQKIGPHVRPDALLMDLTSLKEEPIDAMLRSSRAQVVGAHPMFAPNVGAIHHQVVVLCPARGETRFRWLQSLLESQGAEVVITTPSEHDRMMAIIQVMRHFATLVFGRALSKIGVNIEDTLRFTSPVYRLELMMVGRLFSQEPSLYGEIIMRNPCQRESIEQLVESATHLSKLIADGDRDAFVQEFQDISRYFDDFKDQSMAESTYLIQRMVERM